VPALQTLGQKIAHDTTVATAGADYRDVFTQYRVFALVLPVTRMVGTVDRIHSVTAAKLTTVEHTLAARTTSADSAQVQPLLADLTSKLAAAQSTTSGLPAKLLALTPAQWDANHSLLEAPVAAVKGAVADVKAAAADAKQVRTIERAGRTAGHTAGHAAGHAAAAPAATPAS
jgi:hypothetical protein